MGGAATYAEAVKHISGSTRVFGVIGWPVAHSLSPVFQNHFLAESALNAVYVPFPVSPERLDLALPGLHAAGVAGMNVTVPHKETVAMRVEADADVRRIGAANTLRRSEHGWQATNTDWRGFRLVVEGLELELRGRHVVMFGAGGTARAVVHALAGSGCHLTVCNRSRERASALLDHIAAHYPELQCEAVPWDADAVALVTANAALLVNTTSIGLHPDDRFPFALAGTGAAIDAVYRPDGETAFCRAVRAGGRAAVDGLPLLVAQGAEAFVWWHDAPRPSLARTLAYMQRHLGRPQAPLQGWVAAPGED